MASHIGLALSAIMLAGVVWWALGQEAPTFPASSAEWSWFAAALLLYAIATAIRGERWYELLQAAGASSQRRDAYGLTVVGYMGNNVLPARGGDALRVLLQTPRSRASARTVTGTLIAERIMDAAFLLVLFVALAYVVLRGIDAPSGTQLAIVGAALLVLSLVIGVAVWTRRDGIRTRRVLSFLAPLAAPTRGLRGRYAAWMLVLTACVWTCEAATYYAAIRSVGIEIDAVESAYLVALASVFVLIPSGPGYVGTLDAAILFGLNAVGVAGSEAISALLMLRFVLLLPISAAGLTLLLCAYRSASPFFRSHRDRQAAVPE